MAFNDTTNIIQIILGLLALVLFFVKIIKNFDKQGFKFNFSTQLFLFLLIMVIAETLEHISSSIELIIKPYVPWIYVFASVLILFILLRQTIKSGLITIKKS